MLRTYSMKKDFISVPLRKKLGRSNYVVTMSHNDDTSILLLFSFVANVQNL